MSNPFSDDAPPPPNPYAHVQNPYEAPQLVPQGYYPRQGMVKHIRVIAILLAVQSVLELAMGGVLFFVTHLFASVGNNGPLANGVQQAPMPFEVVVVYGILATAVSLVALVRLWAAIANYFLQRRLLGVIALICGIGTGITCWCAPTGIALAVYGLIVYFNAEVIEAFAMRKTARSADEVLQQFNSRPK